MPASRSLLEIVIDVKNAATGARQIREVGEAGTEAGTGAEQTSKGFGSMAKQLAVAAGGAIAVKKGYNFLKGAANDATTLARSTAGLTRQTGMDAQTSSAWVSIAKSRGIELKQLQTSFTAFSKQQRAAEQGTKGSVQAFKDLGIEASNLKNMNFDQTLAAAADGFQNLPAGADKSALAVKLFGRQGLSLLPLLNMGSDGLREQMKVMKDYGLTMDESGVKKGLELAKSQREMKATTDGIKVSIGQALLPVLVDLAQAFAPVIQGFSKLIQDCPVLGQVVVALGIAFAVAFAVATLGIGPLVAAIIGAVAGIIAGLVMAYSKVGWFRDGVNAVFGAIKGAVGAVAGAFAGIGRAVASAASTAVGALGRVVSFVAGMPGKLGSAFSGMWNGLTSGVQAAVSAVTNTLNQIVATATNIANKVKSALSDIGSAASSALSSATGGLINLQTGGTVPAGGRLAVVGEAGPELMQLPGGTRITPLQQGTPAPVDLGPWGGGGEIHIHLDVDGRELAHVVASQAAEQQARR